MPRQLADAHGVWGSAAGVRCVCPARDRRVRLVAVVGHGGARDHKPAVRGRDDASVHGEMAPQLDLDACVAEGWRSSAPGSFKIHRCRCGDATDPVTVGAPHVATHHASLAARRSFQAVRACGRRRVGACDPRVIARAHDRGPLSVAIRTADGTRRRVVPGCGLPQPLHCALRLVTHASPWRLRRVSHSARLAGMPSVSPPQPGTASVVWVRLGDRVPQRHEPRLTAFPTPAVQPQSRLVIRRNAAI